MCDQSQKKMIGIFLFFSAEVLADQRKNLLHQLNRRRGEMTLKYCYEQTTGLALDSPQVVREVETHR